MTVVKGPVLRCSARGAQPARNRSRKEGRAADAGRLGVRGLDPIQTMVTLGLSQVGLGHSGIHWLSSLARL